MFNPEQAAIDLKDSYVSSIKDEFGQGDQPQLPPSEPTDGGLAGKLGIERAQTASINHYPFNKTPISIYRSDGDPTEYIHRPSQYKYVPGDEDYDPLGMVKPHTWANQVSEVHNPDAAHPKEAIWQEGFPNSKGMNENRASYLRRKHNDLMRVERGKFWGGVVDNISNGIGNAFGSF